MKSGNPDLVIEIRDQNIWLYREGSFFLELFFIPFLSGGGGWVVRRCWVNFQWGGGGGGGPTKSDYSRARAYCALWETALYRLKYCLKGPLNPKQPTNRILSGALNIGIMICRVMQ